jgi:hypothetical protein
MKREKVEKEVSTELKPTLILMNVEDADISCTLYKFLIELKTWIVN